VIFQLQIERAKHRSRQMAERLDQMKEAQSSLSERIDQCSRYLMEFERVLRRARREDVPFLAIHGPFAGSYEVLVKARDANRVNRIRDNWSLGIERLRRAKERLARKIAKTEDRKFQADYWILEKEETWGKIDPQTLKKQIREVLLSAEELSRFLVGKKVPISFDVKEGVPLGRVPIHRKKKRGRKIILSAEILGKQPEHLMDYYRALIVHELGHVLLHTKDTAKDYRRLRRLINKRITAAPGFFDVFNILLDEQLERILRDTKKEWQRWFNRLDFYSRQVPLVDLKGFLASKTGGDPDRITEELAKRQLIKVYPDPESPFATILSGEMFSLGLGFSRLYAFWAMFANKLPASSVGEAWLVECLQCIPFNFKELDVFEIHALAVEIHRIIMDEPKSAVVMIDVDRPEGRGSLQVAVPGTLRGEEKSDEHRLRLVLPPCVKGGGGVEKTRQISSRTITPPVNPEGEPPPPPQQETVVHEQTQPRSSSNLPRWRRGRSAGGRVAGGTGGAERVAGWIERLLEERRGAGGSGRGGCGGRGKAKAPATAKDKLKAKLRSGRLSTKEKTRLQKAAREEEKKAARERKKTPIEPPRKLKTPEVKVPPPAANLGPSAANAERLASAPSPDWSPKDATKDIDQALKQVVEEVRQEMLREQAGAIEVDEITPESTQASDFRNVSETREFPGPEKTLRLKLDPKRRRDSEREVIRYAPILRPYFRVLDHNRVLHERLYSGKRILASGLKKHVAYGEMRLFKDQRFSELEEYQDVMIGVLIDTSASMNTDERLARAKAAASLLGLCLSECPNVHSAFVGYNQNLYLCGTHEDLSVSSLEPAGKTNEAAALAYLRDEYFATACRRKLGIVLSDGLPTACSLESVRWLVHSIEKESGVRFLYGAFSQQEHPAYHRRVNLAGPLDCDSIRAFGRAVLGLLR